MNDGGRLDVFIVASANDIKLLRHFLLSYRLFFKPPGNIHLLVWRKDDALLAKIELPDNLIVHYKDDVAGLVSDDFRNQMYLKLMGDRYVDTEWFWVVDADYLICSPVGYDDFFVEGKPRWFYRPWLDLPEKSWRSGTETLIGQEVPFLFMDEPQYILGKTILGAFREAINVLDILISDICPSEFIAYGSFSYANFHDKYRWINLSDGDDGLLGRKVNQLPPSYMVLNSEVSLDDFLQFDKLKYVVFWSHWGLAEEKMCSFLERAQFIAFGKVKVIPDCNSLYSPIFLDSFVEKGVSQVAGCYTDGWVKDRISLSIKSKVVGFVEMSFSASPDVTGMVASKGKEAWFKADEAGNLIMGCRLSSVEDNNIDMKFYGGAFDENGRALYAKLDRIEFTPHSFFYRVFDKVRSWVL